MLTKLKLFFSVKNKKRFQKLLPKLTFYLYNAAYNRRWLRYKMFKVFYNEEKFKRKRIRAARYPTKPWMRGVEYSKFKKRYQTFLISGSRRFSREVNRTLNSANMFVIRTEFRVLRVFNEPASQFEYFQNMLV